MSPNRPMPPIGALIAALVIADALQSKRDTSNESNKLPPGLEELLSAKCDDPNCEACHPATLPRRTSSRTRRQSPMLPKKSTSANTSKSLPRLASWWA